MKRLNNKGYLLVEIIVAFSLAMGIAYFIINLTIQFSKEEEDIYNSIKITKDTNSITKVIMDDVEDSNFWISDLELESSGNVSSLIIAFRRNKDPYFRTKILIVDKDSNTITYKCLYENVLCDSSDDFSKKLDSHLIIGDIKLNKYYNSGNGGQYAVVKIPITSKLSDENYDIKLLFRTHIK